MRFINIEVVNEYVKGAGVPIGAAGSYSDVALKIKFGDMWDGMGKHITWQDANGENPTIVYLTAQDFDGEYYTSAIPPEAKAVAGTATMSVKGADESKGTLTAKAEFKVLESVYDPDAEESVDPTPTAAEQLQAEIEQILETIATATTAATEAAESASAAEAAAAGISEFADKAESYAVGGTGTRTGEDTDNAKYYKEQAASAAEQAIAVVGVAPATAVPLPNGTGAVGTSGKYAREDHVHPKDPDGRFIATYGTTTYAAVSAEYVAQQHVLYVKVGYDLVPFFEERQSYLIDDVSGEYISAYVFKSDGYVAVIDSNDQWSLIETYAGLAILPYPSSNSSQVLSGLFQNIRIACALGFGVMLVHEHETADEPDNSDLWILYGSNSEPAEDEPATAFKFFNISQISASSVRVNSISISASAIGFSSSPTLITSSWLNRNNAVDAANSNYTTYMARGESLNASETTPTINGTIAWQYE